MVENYKRHDISDKMWKILEPHLPGRPGAWGRVAQDNRRFINAVLWILRTGAPWRDLPRSSPCVWSSRRKSGYGAYKRGLNTKIHLAVDASGMPVHFTVTAGTEADCSQAHELIKGMK